MEKYFAAGFGLLIGLVGLLVSFLQLRNISALNKWQIMRGKVIERGTFQVNKANHGSSAHQFSPLVKYSYQIDGEEFTGDSIFPKHIQNSPRGTAEWAKKEAGKFADEVTVFYNPENPSESFLKPVSKTNMYIVGIVSVLIILFTLGFFVFI